MSQVAENLAEALEAMVLETLEGHDFSDTIREECENVVEKEVENKLDDLEIDADKVDGLDRAIEAAIDDYDFDDKIASVLEDRKTGFVADVTDSTQFQAAVEAAVRAALTKIVTQFLTQFLKAGLSVPVAQPVVPSVQSPNVPA